MIKFNEITFLLGTDNTLPNTLVHRLRVKFPSCDISTATSLSELKGGQLLVALSFGELVPKASLEKYRLAVVIHASALPEGRGWSPANWQLEQLKTEIPVSLITMAEKIDRGEIIDQISIEVPLGELWADFVPKFQSAQEELIVRLISGKLDARRFRNQEGPGTYFRKRSPLDSEIDPEVSLASQWGKLRASDATRFPNFFFLHGNKYLIELTRVDSDENR